MKIDYKAVSAILFIFLLISLYYNFNDEKRDTESITNKSVDCLDLWEKKKDRLFGNEIGNYRVIYNSKLDTCLAGNIYDQQGNTGYGDKYFIFVIDLVTDQILLSYQTHGDEMEDNGLSWNDAIKKYEEYGLRAL